MYDDVKKTVTTLDTNIMDEKEKDYANHMKESMCFDISYIFNISVEDLKIYKFDFTKVLKQDFYYYVATLKYDEYIIVLFLFYDTDLILDENIPLGKFRRYIKEYFKNAKEIDGDLLFSDEAEDTQIEEKLKKVSTFIEVYYSPLICDYNIVVDSIWKTDIIILC